MSTVSKGAGGRSVLVYHEKQTLLLQHCAVHTLNNVLQGPIYTAKHFEDLAHSLQHGGFVVDLGEGQKPAGPPFTPAAAQSSYKGSARSTPAPGTSVGNESATSETGNCFAKCTTGGVVESTTRGCFAAEDGFPPATACQTHAWEVKAPQALECVGGIPGPSVLTQKPAETSSATLHPSTNEAAIFWRTRISSLLLGTDYSAPLGIGNYDLSLLQQLLCFHRLSLNFANNPSRVTATKLDKQECRVLSVVGHPEERGAPTGKFTEGLTFLERQQRVLQQEEQKVLHPSRHEQQLEHQSQQDTLGLNISPRERKEERDEPFSGLVTIEQLRNPRLLAFILNVKVPRRGWRRLWSVLGAERHFYTIRKVSCGGAAHFRLHLRDTANFVSAALPEVTDVLTARNPPSAEVRPNHDELPKQYEERKSDIESGNRYRLRLCDIGGEQILARRPICDHHRASRVTDGGHWKGGNSLSVHFSASGTQENTCGVPQGRYGVDFVWLDLDSNLRTPRAFASENALLTHLNRMLRGASLERGGSSREQRGNITRPVDRFCVQDIAAISSRTVAPVGMNCESSSCKAQEVDFGSGAQCGPKDGAVSRRRIVDSNACGQACVDSGVRKTLGDGKGRVRDRLRTEAGYHRTPGEHQPDVTRSRQYPNNVGTGSAAGARRVGDLSSDLDRSYRPTRHRESNSPVESERAQERREKMITPRALTREDEVADNVYSVTHTEGRHSYEKTGTCEMYCGAVFGTEQEDHRGYKDLILIEVLKDEERSG